MNGGSEAEQTAKFVDMFDKFFDCLNVSNFFDGIHQLKPFRHPYRNGFDFRLKVGRPTYIVYMLWPKFISDLLNI